LRAAYLCAHHRNFLAPSSIWLMAPPACHELGTALAPFKCFAMQSRLFGYLEMTLDRMLKNFLMGASPLRTLNRATSARPRARQAGVHYKCLSRIGASRERAGTSNETKQWRTARKKRTAALLLSGGMIVEPSRSFLGSGEVAAVCGLLIHS
jgi:hypothetical protein